MHHFDQFKNEFNKYSSKERNPQEVISFATWLGNDAIQLYKDAFKQETKHSIPSLPQEKLIEQAYPKGVNEFDKKHLQQAFYSANAQLFIDTCSWVAPAIVNAHSNQSAHADAFSIRHYNLLMYLTLDALTLLEHWAAFTQDSHGVYGIGRNNFHDSFQLSHAVDQLLFTGSPFFTFTDLATDAGTAVLRVALETRLRFGFGLLGVTEKSTGAITPLNLRIVLEAVETHEKNMKLAIPFQHIDRLYGWSNIYVHLGLKSFTWSPIFASRYLNPFLRGVEGGADINSGICISKEMIEAIQDKVESSYGLDPTKEELMKIPAEKCSVVLL